jgi:histidine triad (HIT) family protein
MSPSSCLFCRIAQRQIAADILDETAGLVAFKDVNPQAPVHALIIPREHIASLADASDNHTGWLGTALLHAQKLAQRLGIADGYRVVINTGAQAGQSVFHLHLHLLGGRKFQWPPG